MRPPGFGDGKLKLSYLLIRCCSLFPTPQYSAPVLFRMHPHMPHVRRALEFFQYGVVSFTASGGSLFLEVLPIYQVVFF